MGYYHDYSFIYISLSILVLTSSIWNLYCKVFCFLYCKSLWNCLSELDSLLFWEYWRCCNSLDTRENSNRCLVMAVSIFAWMASIPAINCWTELAIDFIWVSWFSFIFSKIVILFREKKEKEEKKKIICYNQFYCIILSILVEYWLLTCWLSPRGRCGYIRCSLVGIDGTSATRIPTIEKINPKE